MGRLANFILLTILLNAYTATLSYSSVIRDEEIEKYLGSLREIKPHEAYRRINEKDELVNLVKSKNLFELNNVECFSNLDKGDYEKFKKEFGLFNVEGASFNRKLFNLILWARLAECPIMAVNREYMFFYEGFHIYPPNETVLDPINSNLVARYDIYPYSSEKNSSTLPIEACQAVGIQRSQDSLKPGEWDEWCTRKITEDLRNNAPLYMYMNSSHTGIDKQKYEQEKLHHYGKHGLAKISYDFLNDYTIRLERINYLDDILKSLAKLPFNVIKLMRGKAIYLSSSKGNGAALPATSHNSIFSSYLGLIPGIFIQNHPSGSKMLQDNILHLVGHLLNADFERLIELDKKTEIKYIPFPFVLEELKELATKKESLFKANQAYKKALSNDLDKTSIGYITNYSESSTTADFASHFAYYLIDKDKFNKLAKEEATNSSLLQQKYNFMEQLIDIESEYKIKHHNQSTLSNKTDENLEKAQEPLSPAKIKELPIIVKYNNMGIADDEIVNNLKGTQLRSIVEILSLVKPMSKEGDIEELDLSGNILTERGAAAVLKFVNEELPNLKKLNLYDNRLYHWPGQPGYEAFEAALIILLKKEVFKEIDIGMSGLASLSWIQYLSSKIEEEYINKIRWSN